MEAKNVTNQAASPQKPEKKLDELSAMDVQKLRKACRAESLPSEGNREELVRRLLMKKYGRSDRFVPGMTFCKICGSPVKVKSTSKIEENGTLYVVRGVRCEGKHSHSYNLKEIIKKNN